MKQEPTKITISKLAVEELDEVEQMEPEFTLKELVNWVNRAVERFYPAANESADKRVSSIFSVRTLRYYQTIECLDSPQKDGRRAIYGFRHYLQALLIRKLLYLRCSPERIRNTLAGQTNEQYKQMLFSDLQITPAKEPGITIGSVIPEDFIPTQEQWIRIRLTSDIEFHLKKGRTKLSKEEQKQLLNYVSELIQ